MSLVESLTRGVIEHVSPVRLGDAVGQVRLVYEQAEREFALAPPLTVHSVDSQLLAAVWAATREALIVGPHRPVKEAIAASVSVINACPFCVDIHSMMIREDATTVAIQARAPERIEDARTAGAVRFALGTMEPAKAADLAKTIDAADLAAFAGTAVLFHYLNRVVNVFMRDSSPLAAAGFLRRPARALAAATVGRSVTGVAASPGASLALLESQSPNGIPWLDEHPAIGPALAALFRAAQHSLKGLASPGTVTQLTQHFSDWHGEPAPMGRSWLAEATRGIPGDELPVARLALLAGRSAYAVTEEDIASARSIHGRDVELVRMVAWGAGAASRRVADWIGGTP
jgi:AhpD family alkylhydroperoxidase